MGESLRRQRKTLKVLRKEEERLTNRTRYYLEILKKTHCHKEKKNDIMKNGTSTNLLPNQSAIISQAYAWIPLTYEA